MKLTLEEIERKAYMAGDKKLSDFLGKILESDRGVEDLDVKAFLFEDDDTFEDLNAA